MEIRQSAGDNAIQIGSAQDVTITQQFFAFHKPDQAPPLPEYYLPRPEEREKLLQQVLCTSSTPGALVVSAVQGMGGIGKTTLVADLARQPEMRERYPDGVLWTTLGQTPELLNLLHAWIQALGDHKYSPLTPDDAAAHLRSLLHDRACLLVVDDAWNPDHVRPFLVGGDRCQILITTRDATLAKRLNAHLYDLDVMSEAQALGLFEKRLGALGEHRPTAAALAKELGYLPLALELAAAQVADGQTWTKLLAALRKGLAGLDALSLDEATHRNESLRLSFKLSLEMLAEEERQSFAWFGVLPEDAQLNPPMAATLWQLPAEDAAKRLQRFRNKALLKTMGEERYTLHDLLHDEAKLRLALEMPLTEAHARLLDRYYALCEPAHPVPGQALDSPATPRLWHTIPDDDYIFPRLTWHMEQAGQIETIFTLLQEETGEGRNGWYWACQQNGQLAVFLADLKRARKLVQTDEITHPNLGQNLALEFLVVLCHASIVSQSSNYPAELLVLAVQHKLLHPHHALTLAEQIAGDEKLRAKALTGLAPHLLPELQAIALPQALAAAQAIRDKEQRAKALTALAPHLPPELLPQALAAAQAIYDQEQQASALADLALLHLPPELLPQALAAAQAIGDEGWRAKALTGLAPHLPPELQAIALPQALAAAQVIGDERHRASALAALAPHLPPELQATALPQALAAAQDIGHEYGQVETLTALAPHLPPELQATALHQALTATQDIGDDDRAQALTDLAPLLNSWSSQFPDRGLATWHSALDFVAQCQRKELLSEMGFYTSFALSFLLPEQHQPFIAGVFRAVQSVCRWWP